MLRILKGVCDDIRRVCSNKNLPRSYFCRIVKQPVETSILSFARYTHFESPNTVIFALKKKTKLFEVTLQFEHIFLLCCTPTRTIF